MIISSRKLPDIYHEHNENLIFQNRFIITKSENIFFTFRSYGNYMYNVYPQCLISNLPPPFTSDGLAHSSIGHPSAYYNNTHRYFRLILSILLAYIVSQP